MNKNKKSTTNAIREMMAKLSSLCIEDKIEDMVNQLFYQFVEEVEDGVEVLTDDGDEYPSSEEWYDELKEEFRERAYDKIKCFANNNTSILGLIEKNIEGTIAKYGPDHVDMAYTDGLVYLFYHSDNNSFVIDGTKVYINSSTRHEDLRKICDHYDIGLCEND